MTTEQSANAPRYVVRQAPGHNDNPAFAIWDTHEERWASAAHRDRTTAAEEAGFWNRGGGVMERD